MSEHIESIIETTEKRRVFCKLTAEEAQSRGQDLAAAITRAQSAEARKRAAAAEVKAEKETVEALREVVYHQQEERLLDCRKVLCFDTGLCTIYHPITNDVLFTRPISTDERQPYLFPEEDEQPEGETVDPWDAIVEELSINIECPSCRIQMGHAEDCDLEEDSEEYECVAFARAALALLDDDHEAALAMVSEKAVEALDTSAVRLAESLLEDWPETDETTDHEATGLPCGDTTTEEE